MKNREKFIFSILLLLMHTAGAVGALTITLGLECGTVLKTPSFLSGVGVLCAFAVLFWTRCSRRRLLIRGASLLTAYSVILLIFRKSFLNSLAWAMSSAVERINERNDIRLIWSWTTGSDAAKLPGEATLSVLMVLLPYILLLGYGVIREHVMAVILADAVWFTAACGMDSFPDYVWLILCVLSIAAQIILNGYRDHARAGMIAAILGTAVTAAVMVLIYYILLPVMDGKYEQMLEARIELNRRVNEEWIPRVQDAFSPFGFGHAVDVSGSLDRGGGTVLTSRDIYRVTLSSAPKTAVYLRGFVGVEYAGDEWKAGKDSDLTKYYRAQGWDVPESARELMNLTYEVFGGSSGFARVEELAGAGHYSLYPYGAKLPEDYRVHWDGTADRKGRVCEFSYCALTGRRAGRLSEEQAAEERRYRSYVYDTFCEYPAERFPELTAFLEGTDFKGGNVYKSLTEVFVFLRQQAVYDLEAADPPSGEDFVEYFLFDSRRGYCAHFASSAVLILRYLGVPARYVTGYSLSADAFSKDAEGTYTAVATDTQAHAWVEVYLDGVGWIPMEMTPGAVAFTRDDSMAQLQLAGQLSGAYSQGGTSEPQIGSVGELEEAPEETTPGEMQEPEETAPLSGESEEAPAKPKQEQQREPVRPERPSGGQSEPEEDEAERFPVEKIRRPERSPFALSPAINAAMSWILAAGSLALLSMGALQGIRRLYRKRYDSGDNRDKVFLLYQNLKRLLWLAGHEGRMGGEDSETRGFRRILEKSSFGEKEPTFGEVRGAADFCGKLAGKEYEGLPAWKKPLFRCLNVYPQETVRDTEGWRNADH